MYRIRDFKKRAEKVEEPAKEEEEIQKRHEAAMKKEQNIFLDSQEVDPVELASTSSESDTNSKCSNSYCDSDNEDNKISCESEVSAQKSEAMFEENDIPAASGAQNDSTRDENISSVHGTSKQGPLLYINSTLALVKLRELSCNLGLPS